MGGLSPIGIEQLTTMALALLGGESFRPPSEKAHTRTEIQSAARESRQIPKLSA